MTRPSPLAACAAVIFSWCPAARAYQAPADATVSITPRSASRPSADPQGIPQAHLRVDSSLVLIPVHATTSGGAPVTSLRQQDFQLFEDGVEQKITHFFQEDGPISAGLLVDASDSMRNKVHQSAEAAAAFFKTANPDDEFFLVEFGERPKLAVSFTPDTDAIIGRIRHNRPIGRTSLLDAIHVAMVEMKHARNSRKAIVILSDGGDNRSRYTAGEIKNALLESDLQVYAMGIFDPDLARRHPAEERNGPRLLSGLAQLTGGRLYTVENLDDLASISANISRGLRSQYVLGYAPANSSRDAKYRKVTLKVTGPDGTPNLQMEYRRGYYAPSE